MKRQIHIAAAIIINANRQTLLVRKAGTQYFMQAGGKIDAGETPDIALQRELVEELGIVVDPNALEPLGQFRARAANEADSALIADLFLLEADFDVKPANEIAEAVWVSGDVADSMLLAPLTRDYVLPIVRKVAATK